MDVVTALQEREIFDILEPTINAFRPHLKAHRAEIESANRSTFKFGSTDRHQLDVYYPPAEAKPIGGKYPVLFFMYGGGFFSGWRVYDPPNELGYKNLGAFFSKRGFVTVIPDYRICPGTTYPEPTEDVRDAIAWVVHHASEVSGGASVPPDLENIFAMGTSAGAIQVATLLLHPTLLSPDLRRRIRGIIMQNGMYASTPERPALPPHVVLELFGSWEGARNNMPVGLLARAPKEIVETFPPVLFQLAEKDPDDVVVLAAEFAPLLKAKVEKEADHQVMKNHNHISPHWALCTGQGEEWAVDVELWIKARVVSK